jgi:hypothetical protein
MRIDGNAAVTKSRKARNEHFICPIHSDVLKITGADEKSVQVNGGTARSLVFQPRDCAISSTRHSGRTIDILVGRATKGLNADHLIKRGIHTLSYRCRSAWSRSGLRWEIPHRPILNSVWMFVTFITKGDVNPMPLPG